MRTVVGALLAVAGLLASATVPAGPVRYTMQLEGRGSGRSFRIRLERREAGVLAYYQRLVRFRSEALARDSEATRLAAAFVAAMRNQGMSKAAKEAVSKQYSARVDRYNVFRQDSLWLPASRVPAFVQLLDSVRQASPAELEQRERNRHRYVLDGTTISLLVQPAAGPPTEAYAHSPTLATHPLLYRLLHQSLQVYRAQKPRRAARLLPLSYTSDY